MIIFCAERQTLLYNSNSHKTSSVVWVFSIFFKTSFWQVYYVVITFFYAQNMLDIHFTCSFLLEKVQKRRLSSWLNEKWKKSPFWDDVLFHWPEVKRIPKLIETTFIHLGTHKLIYYLCVLSLLLLLLLLFLLCMWPCAKHQESKDKYPISNCTKLILCGKSDADK